MSHDDRAEEVVQNNQETQETQGQLSPGDIDSLKVSDSGFKDNHCCNQRQQKPGAPGYLCGGFISLFHCYRNSSG